MGYVKFLGTAGARFVVARQLRSSAGTWIELDGVEMLLDPGPGTLLRARKSRPALDPTQLSAIFLSHKHLDHSTDVNIMIEAMADGGLKARGTLLAPRDALEGEDPVVLRYVRPFLKEIQVWEEGRVHEVGPIRIHPVRHDHGQVEAYGLILESSEGRVGFLVDAKFHPQLAGRYEGCDLLVLNVVMRDWKPEVDHLCLDEAARVVDQAKPRLAVLTHFGMSMLRANPRLLATRLSEQLGRPVLAATDGLSIPSKDWNKGT